MAEWEIPRKNEGTAAKKKQRPSATDKGMSLCCRQSRTEFQIRRSLAKSAYSAGEIDCAIKNLIDTGYINDKDYAERFLEILIGKKRGRRRVLDDLKRHGIEAALAEKTVREGYSVEDEKKNAEAAAYKAIKVMPQGRERKKVRDSLYRHLTSQGYGYDITAAVMDSVFSREQDYDYEYTNDD